MKSLITFVFEIKPEIFLNSLLAIDKRKNIRKKLSDSDHWFNFYDNFSDIGG